MAVCSCSSTCAAIESSCPAQKLGSSNCRYTHLLREPGAKLFFSLGAKTSAETVGWTSPEPVSALAPFESSDPVSDYAVSASDGVATFEERKLVKNETNRLAIRVRY